MRLLALLGLTLASAAACAHTLQVRGNRIILDGKRGEVLYRSSGDLDGDAREETVFSVWSADGSVRGLLIARRMGMAWQWVGQGDQYLDDLRTDVTDVNGDRRMEIVARGTSADGHGICHVEVLRAGRVLTLGSFGQTRFRDLDGDRIPEVVSVSWISFGFVGDHWLTIYKWNGQNYTDVSRRFPREYDAVIRDIRREIYLLRYTKAHGSRHEPSFDPDLFADMYYHLGRAYEYRGLLDKAREQYAIAYRLQPDNEEIVADFRRTWKKKPPARQ